MLLNKERGIIMKKKFLAIFTCLAMLLCLTACSSKRKTHITTKNRTTASSKAPAPVKTPVAKPNAQTPANNTTDPNAPIVGISMPSRKLLRWSHDGAYLNRAFAGAGFQTILKFADDKPEQQIEDIQDMIDGNAKVIIVSAIDSGSLDDVLDKANAKNIPVVAYDRLIKNDAVEYIVTFDNLACGTLQGEFVADALKLETAAGPFNIEFTTGDITDANADFYFTGAYNVLKPYIDSGKVKILSGENTLEKVATAGWDTNTAKDRAAGIIKKNYSGTKLDAWVCANDSTALGIADAISENYSGSNSVIVTGQDGEEAALKNIVDGKQSMTVYKMVSNEAIVTKDLVEMIIKGLVPDENLIETSDWIFEVTYDTESYKTSETKACTAYLLMPDVVTVDNMDEKLIDTGNFIRDENGYLKSVN